MRSRQSFLCLVAFLSVTTTVLAAVPVFINPPASNVVVSADSFPVYQTGKTLVVKWTSNSSYEPLNVQLRADSDGILSPSSGISVSLVANSNVNSTSWVVTSNVLSKHQTYYLVAIKTDRTLWYTSNYFNITDGDSSSVTSSTTSSSISSSTSSSTSSSSTSSSSTSSSSTSETFTSSTTSTPAAVSATSTPSETSTIAPQTQTSTNAVAIGVGVAVPVVAILVAAFFFWRWRKNKKNAQSAPVAQYPVGNGVAFKPYNEAAEMDVHGQLGPGHVPEMVGSPGHEYRDGREGLHELG